MAMKGTDRLKSPLQFSEDLYQRMLGINKGIGRLALYEFRYALDNIIPPGGWDSLELDEPGQIESMLAKREFYTSIQLKYREKDRILLDPGIARLTRMLLAGLCSGKYTPEWVNKKFYFDVRGFYFLPRTVYFTEKSLAHFGGKPWQRFEERQKAFELVQDISYQEFQAANQEIDGALITLIQKLTTLRGTPVLITLAGPTAAGKTEITERLMEAFEQEGKSTTSIEMDNFLLDRELREGKSIDRTTIHYDLFAKCLKDILQGKKITTPCYDSSDTTSSHDPQGNLRPGRHTIEVPPGDVIFLEGNFPFQSPEVRSLINFLVVYLTDDPIRLKRKWKRDVDYRKNYEVSHFRNRFFMTQFLRAEDCFRAMIEQADIVADTTHAALWVTPALEQALSGR